MPPRRVSSPITGLCPLLTVIPEMESHNISTSVCDTLVHARVPQRGQACFLFAPQGTNTGSGPEQALSEPLWEKWEVRSSPDGRRAQVLSGLGAHRCSRRERRPGFKSQPDAWMLLSLHLRTDLGQTQRAGRPCSKDKRRCRPRGAATTGLKSRGHSQRNKCSSRLGKKPVGEVVEAGEGLRPQRPWLHYCESEPWRLSPPGTVGHRSP